MLILEFGSRRGKNIALATKQTQMRSSFFTTRIHISLYSSSGVQKINKPGKASFRTKCHCSVGPE